MTIQSSSQPATQAANPSILNHVSLGTNQVPAACAFYDAVLATIGARRVLDFPEAVAYGKQFPEFWISSTHNGEPATVGNGAHFAFNAENQAQVDLFYRTALDQGATSEGEPGPRPEYTDAYYGCFLRDLDGNKIEAIFWNPEASPNHPH